MWIQVRTMDGRETHRVDSLSKLTKVDDLRLKISELFKVEPEKQRLFYRGKQVSSGCPPSGPVDRATTASPETRRIVRACAATFSTLPRLTRPVPQMEDGHTIFDYNVGLNDIVQLLVRNKMPAVDVIKSKDKEAELSDSDSGCGSTQSESDKNSTHGEAEAAAGPSAQTAGPEPDAPPELVDPGFGSYKINELVDARDLNMGAWFEAQIVNVTKTTAAPSVEAAEAPAAEEILYHVKYEE
ncbi:E3 ubiquitin-protein ligase UHRF1 [Liparis tanakae]|uniref:E3 ubiquitin-protein ligase UHRF1 n=1 Tax=Liparis tanakae TaxID=230148 RepID=A0A4Z2EGX7_9TELE|nr:E3 ubiquitin-protein ligase UHRF1 [Liparis tanakae]